MHPSMHSCQPTRCVHSTIQKTHHSIVASNPRDTGNRVNTKLKWVFPKIMYPQIIHFNRIFHYKPSIWGTPTLGNTQIHVFFCQHTLGSFVAWLHGTRRVFFFFFSGVEFYVSYRHFKTVSCLIPVSFNIL